MVPHHNHRIAGEEANDDKLQMSCQSGIASILVSIDSCAEEEVAVDNHIQVVEADSHRSFAEVCSKSASSNVL